MDRGFVHFRRGVVLRDHLGRRLGHRAELRLQLLPDAGVESLTLALEHALVCGVLDESMLERESRLGAGALPEHESRIHELVQRHIELRRVHTDDR